MNTFNNRLLLLVIGTICLLIACEKENIDPISIQIQGDGLCNNCTDDKVTTGDTVFLDPQMTNAGRLRCNEVKFTAEQIRTLSATLMSDNATGVVYPGAILQGGLFREGNFTRVTIPTKGGKLILDGLSGGNSRTELVPSFEPGDVADGIARLLQGLSGSVQGTEARFSFALEQVNSASEFRFNLGLDARFPFTSIEGRFGINRKTEGSRVMLQFSQRFYSISVEDPVDPYSFFKDGRNAQDPGMQIGPDNPPLYVKSVHYGRQIFFMAESTYSTEDVKASLRAAFENKPIDTKVGLSSDLTVKEVLDASNVTYVVIGGSAEIALKEAPTYENVQDVISEGASWSLANPGSPIAYDLRYLANGQPARMAFVTDFVRKTCELESGEVFDIFPFKLNMKRCPGEDDGIAEFRGLVRVSTSQDLEEKEFNINLDVSIPSEEAFPLPDSNKVTIGLVEPEDNDFIKLNYVNLQEIDDPNGVSPPVNFANRVKYIYWKDLKGKNEYLQTEEWYETKNNQGGVFNFIVQVKLLKQ